ncbi:hypothetical protein [Mediannikoviicoccus vaginalis]|uniref:hypothetical protein n=1 Tax=Mediannikoviicoccus vaginalis TaxID=2899727 RepID=UPI001F3FE624|nr:hypothetical protein [Mediannikoviicoccus vaginalis]
MEQNTDYNAKLNELKNKLDVAKANKTKAEGMLETLNNNKEEIIVSIREMGIEPEDLENEILNLQTQIDSLLFEAEKLLAEE